MNTTFEQRDHGFLTYPTNPWHIALFKWPIQLWRLGFGPIIGRIFILFTHTGRKSGQPRRTMTERYYLNGRDYAPSGFGRRPQWWRNIEVDPLVTIQTADGVQSARAVRVTDGEELLMILDAVSNRSQMMLDTLLESLEVKPTKEDILAKKDRFYWLRFDPTDEPTPPPLPADLVWLWPVSVAALLLLWLVNRRQ